jgi:hypothetical protein
MLLSEILYYNLNNKTWRHKMENNIHHRDDCIIKMLETKIGDNNIDAMFMCAANESQWIDDIVLENNKIIETIGAIKNGTQYDKKFVLEIVTQISTNLTEQLSR